MSQNRKKINLPYGNLVPISLDHRNAKRLDDLCLTSGLNYDEIFDLLLDNFIVRKSN